MPDLVFHTFTGFNSHINLGQSPVKTFEKRGDPLKKTMVIGWAFCSSHLKWTNQNPYPTPDVYHCLLVGFLPKTVRRTKKNPKKLYCCNSDWQTFLGLIRKNLDLKSQRSSRLIRLDVNWLSNKNNSVSFFSLYISGICQKTLNSNQSRLLFIKGLIWDTTRSHMTWNPSPSCSYADFLAPCTISIQNYFTITIQK